MKTRNYLLSVVIVGLVCFAAGAAANKNAALSPKTKQNLTTAMKGEAFAHAKYLLYAEEARKNGNAELADLFEKTAKVERLEHFAEEARLLGLVGDNQANLRDAIKGESYEVETMYREFAQQAEKAGDNSAANLFAEIRKDETNHRDEFKAALEKIGPKVASGK
ncbi:MAG TPA: rubrerythrin family protein [Candidatus Angelobacter sp.]